MYKVNERERDIERVEKTMLRERERLNISESKCPKRLFSVGAHTNTHKAFTFAYTSKTKFLTHV